MIKKYVKKRIPIEAIQYTGLNFWKIIKFCGEDNIKVVNKKPINTSKDLLDNIVYFERNNDIYIVTLEGNMQVSVGDYIIKGIKGEYYPCKPDIFEESYEEYTDKEPDKFDLNEEDFELLKGNIKKVFKELEELL